MIVRRGPMMAVRPFLLGPLLLQLWLPAAAVAAASPAAKQPTLQPKWAPFVRVETLVASHSAPWLKANGRLGYDEDHTQQIRPPVNGRITKVFVRLGQQVRTGEPLVSLASAEAAQLKAELKKDVEDVAVFARARVRARALLKDGAVAPREVAEAEANYNKAQAELARDQEHIAALGLDVARPGAEAVLVSRMPGIVTAREAAVGAELRADAGQPLVVISDLSRLWLWANVFERDLAHVVEGAAVEAKVAAYPHRTFAGRVDYVGDVLDADTHSVRVRCTLANPQRALKPHMFAEVSIAQPAVGSLWLASDAVVMRAEQTFVVVVAEGDQLSLRPVRLGAIVAGQQPVLEGLVAGERVVTKGAVLVAQTLSEHVASADHAAQAAPASGAAGSSQ